ncbi:transcriptional repressor [Oceanispirochaeta crateris]|uniref:Transcriptional repressor n=2 Tax=Oceanispirochaeta crateris TaxID=2518645 RepID=A0A5C1QJH5_9SPIO|nr:transcriptional repressor [Oceanispirochaeta crateris]
MEYRKSKQRDEILNILRETNIHPTANWIYDKLKKENSRLSLGTVYRNLSILVEQDLVDRIDFGSTFDRYEAKKGGHYHFVCENCGEVSDLEMPVMEELNSQVEKKFGLKTNKHRLEFFGICRKCG